MKNMVFICTVLLMSAAYVPQATAQKQNHKEYQDMKISECNDCHKGEGVALNHDADWVRQHRSIASKAGSNCAQCHTQAYCLDCHQGGGINADLTRANFGQDYIPRSHRRDFVQIHPLKSLDNPQSCYRCHDQRFCNECHSRYPRGSFRIRSHLPSGTGQLYSGVWSSEHSREARRNLQTCQSCHPDGDVCLRCHGGNRAVGLRVNPHPKNFQGGNISRRTDRTCRACH
ncbi:cytochrome c [Geomonas silvestris]|uniref:Cytochrome c n=1 Tax=Geomonas silvestris TaxID=2740184 RepID=A0A6V8MKS1_9BACT|nr:cytochrome C [Geomonas silvestris]GFO60572.1 cytochrome c [Geomonas silvestris]